MRSNFSFPFRPTTGRRSRSQRPAKAKRLSALLLAAAVVASITALPGGAEPANAHDVPTSATGPQCVLDAAFAQNDAVGSLAVVKEQQLTAWQIDAPIAKAVTAAFSAGGVEEPKTKPAWPDREPSMCRFGSLSLTNLEPSRHGPIENPRFVGLVLFHLPPVTSGRTTMFETVNSRRVVNSQLV